MFFHSLHKKIFLTQRVYLIDSVRNYFFQPFDIVLLDLRMPGMNGMAVLRTSKEKWPECEVIIITGYPAVESAKEAVTLGAYDYLAKPISVKCEMLGLRISFADRSLASRVFCTFKWCSYCTNVVSESASSDSLSSISMDNRG